MYSHVFYTSVQMQNVHVHVYVHVCRYMYNYVHSIILHLYRSIKYMFYAPLSCAMYTYMYMYYATTTEYIVHIIHNIYTVYMYIYKCTCSHVYMNMHMYMYTYLLMRCWYG